MSTVIATGEDLRTARAAHGGYCARGVALWFKRHNLDFRKFMQEGLPADALRVDELGKRVADMADERTRK